MTATTAILVCLQAKHGEQVSLEEFLRNAAPAAREDPALVAWVASRFSRYDYGLFAAFPDAESRERYVATSLNSHLLREAGLHLDEGVAIEKLDVISCKLPASLPAQPDSKGVMLNFKAKVDGADAVESFLRDARAHVMEEEETTSWFAVRNEAGVYSLFATFGDNGGRLKNLVGYVPSQLAHQALNLLGSMPDMDMLDVIAAKIECDPQ